MTTFEAVVLAHSISPDGIKLCTVQKTYPRIVHAEEMTHRVMSRNSASTRAIPLVTQLRNLLTNPFIPEKFGVNMPGMQAAVNLSGMKHEHAVEIWLAGRDRALTTTIELILGRDIAGDLLGYDPSRDYVHGDVMLEKLDEIIAVAPKSTDQIDLAETSMLNVHKQLAGRGLEAYMWHTVIVTATEWDNYFGLRVHPDAQGEIATIARLTQDAIEASTPTFIDYGEWHTPLVDKDEFDDAFDAIRASAARCAAASYNRQMMKNPEKEFGRYVDLRRGGHMSPLEHQATPLTKLEWSVRRRMADVALNSIFDPNDGNIVDQLVESTQFLGNFRGWRQHRKDVLFENDFSKLPRK